MPDPSDRQVSYRLREVVTFSHELMDPLQGHAEELSNLWGTDEILGHVTNLRHALDLTQGRW